MTPKRWAVVCALAVAAIVIAIALMLFRPSRPAPPRVERLREKTSSVEPTDTVEATATTATPEPTGVISPKPSPAAWKSPAPVVFARDGMLWRIREDGRGRARRVLSLEDGATYLLSPDRTKVAYTESAGRRRVLLVEDMVAGRKYKVADDTAAFQGLPYAWASASGRLAYTVPIYSGGKRVREDMYAVDYTGDSRKLLAKQAGAPAWAPGERIVFRRVNVSRGTWQLFTVSPDGGRPLAVPQSAQATAYSLSPRDDLAFAVTGSGQNKPVSSIVIVRSGATSPVTVLREALDQANYMKLAWSRDTRQIAIDRSGDDGYSRTVVVGVTDYEPAWEVNAARDNYLLGWSADGSRLLYFEGNSFQGAPSNLWAVKRSGTGRRVIVTDAAAQ